MIERPKWDISAAIMAPLSFMQDNRSLDNIDPLNRLSANLEYSRLLIGDKTGSALSVSAHIGTGDHMTHKPTEYHPSFSMDSSIPLEARLGVKVKF